ncbi:hypothetical protein NQ317_011377 [Molorchus minor]|uniref:GST C-terminal domain-containing protein n=1 Tax=Molorchus minor TaxID=1323400 RepID=A0ABQ9JCK3_9CUCU|nr:hypothetical protein NQ317_011377 [Molorchus minor]
MWLIGKRLKKRHHLKEDVRQSLYDECNKWVKAVNAKGKKFMGGDHPNLADLAVYGILNSIEGCVAFKDLVDHTNIRRWYFDMKESVAMHQGAIDTKKFGTVCESEKAHLTCIEEITQCLQIYIIRGRPKNFALFTFAHNFFIYYPILINLVSMLMEKNGLLTENMKVAD